MSDHIPIEIQIEILRRLPLISVIRFASVSKQWNSLIHSSKFVNDYSLQTMHTQRLFIVEKRDYKTRPIIYSFVDDDTFPHNKSIPFLPESVNNLLNVLQVAGSSHGLLCLIGSSVNNCVTDTAVIWNPMIRQSVSIPLPNVMHALCQSDCTSFGFGVCPKTCDPKIVKINPKMMMGRLTLEDTRRTNWQVEVFTLSSGEWRKIPSPDKLLTRLWDEPLVVDGFIYWLVNVTETIDPFKKGIKALVSFDLTSEEFKQVYQLPDKLQSSSIQIFKFRESLAIFERESSEVVYKVWIMENGALKELLNVDGILHLSVYQQPVLRRNGQLILRDTNRRQVVYNPDSNQINILGIYGNHRSSYVSSITESLLLLDRS